MEKITAKELDEMIGKCLEKPKLAKHGDVAFNVAKFQALLYERCKVKK